MQELAQQVLQRCDELAACSEATGQLTRTYLSPPMHQVHALLRQWMHAAGMSVHIDAVGNLRGHYPANVPNAPRLLIGSHLDSVPDAGKYDGPLGVLLGLAIVQALQGQRLPIALEVVGFSEEEGVRFKVPFFGSRALVGTFDPDWLNLPDEAGTTVAQAIQAFGLDPQQIPQAKLQGDYLGYLEFHIEQGPVLEAHKLALGVVSHIVGMNRLELFFAGQAAHAGTTPMPMRRDALAGAAEYIQAVEYFAQRTEGLVATVGRVWALPGAGNVIPGRVGLSLDVRHASDEVRLEALGRLLAIAQRVANDRHLTFEYHQQLQQQAVPMNPRLQKLLRQALQHNRQPAYSLVSGAGHDAMIMAQAMPAAMLFVRSPEGISHNPLEAVIPTDIEAALKVGLRFVRLLGEAHA